jgi:hypothetical protein
MEYCEIGVREPFRCRRPSAGKSDGDESGKHGDDQNGYARPIDLGSRLLEYVIQEISWITYKLEARGLKIP